jgi:hypothetical protein
MSHKLELEGQVCVLLDVGCDSDVDRLSGPHRHDLVGLACRSETREEQRPDEVASGWQFERETPLLVGAEVVVERLSTSRYARYLDRHELRRTRVATS